MEHAQVESQQGDHQQREADIEPPVVIEGEEVNGLECGGGRQSLRIT
jgi:hypothetical protein